MLKNVYLAFCCLTLFACQRPEKSFSFEGAWVEKSLLEGKDKPETSDLLTYVPLILFDETVKDSALVYYSADMRKTYFAELAYQTYFVHLDKDTEYFFAPDFSTEELVFSNLKDKNFKRYIRVAPHLTREELLSASFDLDSLIRTVK